METFGSFDEEKQKSDRNRRLLAAVLSMVVPGSGQFLEQRMVSGAVFLAIYVDIWLGFVWFRLPRFYAGFVLLMLSLMAIVWVASLNAAFGKGISKARLSRWWIVPLVLGAILAMAPQIRLTYQLGGFWTFHARFRGMEPGIQSGDQLLVDRRAFASHGPEFGDVVIFKRNKTYFLKRVIAVAGQEITGKDGTISVNGNVLNEPYAHSSLKAATASDEDDDEDINPLDFGPVKVPAGKLFVAGDNCDLSFDSRSTDFGLVDVRDVIGKPLFVYRGTQPGREGTLIH